MFPPIPYFQTMNMRKNIIIAACMLVFASSLCAQESGRMDVKDCMRYAVSNSTKMRVREAAIGDARIDRREAILRAFTPSVSARMSAYYNFGRTVDPQTNTYVSTTTFYNSYGLSAGITLFDGFEAVNNIKISKTSLAMGYSEEEQAEADICLATMEAYYNAVYYSKISDIYREQVQTAESSVTLARKQESLGVKSYADVVQAESELADRKYELTNAENLRNDAMTTLQDVMFWPLDSALVIETDIDVSSFFLPESEQATEGIVEYAKEHNPAALIALGTLKNAKLALSSARGQLLPTLSLNGGWSTTYYEYPNSSYTVDPFRDQFRNNGGEYVQLSMSIPIYDRLSVHNNIARKKNAVRKASAEYDQKLRDIEAEVRRAVQDRDGAAASYLQAERKGEVQEESYSLNKGKYEQGLISGIELQSATDKYLAAKADRLNSMFKFLIKKSVVEYYNGTKYTEQ